LKRVVAELTGVEPTAGPDSDRLSPAVPFTRTVVVETTDTNTPEPSMLMERGMSATNQPTEVESASPIARRVRNNPRTRHTFILQTSPYVNPVTHVYKSRKHPRCPPHELYSWQRRWKGTGEGNLVRRVVLHPY